MNMLKELPAWIVLVTIFLALLIAYYVRPDAVTVDMIKTVLGAILLALQLPKPKNEN